MTLADIIAEHHSREKRLTVANRDEPEPIVDHDDRYPATILALSYRLPFGGENYQILFTCLT